jgi:hypothetical protein
MKNAEGSFALAGSSGEPANRAFQSFISRFRLP